MAKIEFIVQEGSGLETEESKTTFFREIVGPRLLELLKVILSRDFSVSKVETRQNGPYDPRAQIIAHLDGEADKKTLGFVANRIRIENPGKFKDW